MGSKETEWLEQRAGYSLGVEGWRNGRQGGGGGEEGGRGVMGMVLGHIFNHVTKKVPAWETRLCFSNPAGRLRSTLLPSAQLTLATQENTTTI